MAKLVPESVGRVGCFRCACFLHSMTARTRFFVWMSFAPLRVHSQGSGVRDSCGEKPERRLGPTCGNSQTHNTTVKQFEVSDHTNEGTLILDRPTAFWDCRARCGKEVCRFMNFACSDSQLSTGSYCITASSCRGQTQLPPLPSGTTTRSTLAYRELHALVKTLLRAKLLQGFPSALQIGE